MTKPVPENETGLALGAVLIALLLAPVVALRIIGLESGPIRATPAGALLGAYLMIMGAMLVASFFYSHKTFFLRGLMWLCENVSFPAGRRMALAYGLLLMLVGGAVTLVGTGAW